MKKKPRESELCPACEVALNDRRICPRCGLACGKGDSAYAARPWLGGTYPSGSGSGDDGNYALRKADKD